MKAAETASATSVTFRTVCSHSSDGSRSQSDSGEVRDSWKPRVVFQNSRRPPSGRTGTSTTAHTIRKAALNRKASRRRSRRVPAASAGASNAGANFAIDASAASAPRAGAEVIASSA
jgi:hypothetical protein